MILVTGATGLVGSHLIAQLVNQTEKIRALYRSEAKKEQAKKVFMYYHDTSDAFDQIDWVKVDINDIPALEEAFDKITYVYHCAAMISFNPKHYRKLRKINIEGTANIVNLAIAYNVKKLCHVSSIASLGTDPTKNYIDEHNEWNSESLNSVYAITKYGAEMEVWRATQEGLDVIIVNPGIIIGAGFFKSGSGSLFTKIYHGFKYYTCGITGYVDIIDVVQPMLQLMKGEYSNERYILVSENLSYKNVFTQIAKILKQKVPTKKVSPLLFQVAWRLEWLSSTIFGTKRSIYKTTAESIFSASYYKNDKIIKTLNYRFIPIDKSIKETASYFLQEL